MLVSKAILNFPGVCCLLGFSDFLLLSCGWWNFAITLKRKLMSYKPIDITVIHLIGNFNQFTASIMWPSQREILDTMRVFYHIETVKKYTNLLEKNEKFHSSAEFSKRQKKKNETLNSLSTSLDKNKLIKTICLQFTCVS